jgi:integrase
LEHLKSLDFSDRTIRFYATHLRKISEHLELSGLQEYSEEAGASYLAKASGIYASGYLNQVSGMVRRLNCFCSRTEYKKRVLKPRLECPDRFKAQFDAWADRLRKIGRSEGSIDRYKFSVVNVLIDFVGQGVQSFSDVKTENILRAFSASRDKKAFPAALRSILKHLAKEGGVSPAILEFFPRPAPGKPLPSVYSKEELAALFSCIDKASAKGKRNLAIIMLAYKMGLRAGDIAGLRFRDLDLEGMRLRIVQDKTETALELPLVPEALEALDAYVSEARPPSSSDHVFLSLTKPIGEIGTKAVSKVVLDLFKKSGVEANGRKTGPHSLRSTFSSELAEEDFPSEVITSLLGQVSPEVSTSYVARSVRQLRQCALDVPPLSGRLAELLGCGDA